MIQRKDGNTMKQNDILDSIGGISDSIIDEAVDYVPKSKSVKRLSVKRISTIAAAAVLCIALTVTCFANATEISAVISSLFRREEKYVEPYSQVINQTDSSEKVSMTVRKVAKYDDNYILFLTMHASEPFAPGFLICDSYSLEYIANGEKQTYKQEYIDYEFEKTSENQIILRGINLKNIISYDSTDISCHLMLPIREDAESQYSCLPWESGRYHFEINNLALCSYYCEDENDMLEKKVCYADKLEVDFDFNENEIKDLPATVIYPETEFDLAGTHFRLNKIEQTATQVKLIVEDLDKKRIEIGNRHFYGANKLIGFGFLPFEKVEMDYVSTLEFIDKYKLSNITYSAKIEFAGEAADTCRIEDMNVEWFRNEYGAIETDRVEITLYTESAISMEDIKSIYFEAHVFDSYPIEKYIDYEIIKVTAWENKAE